MLFFSSKSASELDPCLNEDYSRLFADTKKSLHITVNLTG